MPNFPKTFSHIPVTLPALSLCLFFIAACNPAEKPESSATSQSISVVKDGSGKTADLSPLENAQKAYENQDFGTALKLLLPLAQNNDRVAQFLVGDMHAKGQGTNQDQTIALTWFEKALTPDFTFCMFLAET